MSSKIERRQTARQRANSELAERAIRHGHGLAVHRPVQVYLQLASACNLSCYMCSEHNRPPEVRRGVGLISLSPEIFSRLEKEVFPWSSQLFLGVGGEPTFSEHFVDYVTRGGAANQEVNLITNGTFLERSAVARAVAENVSRIQVSIDAATEQTYERIRIGSRWSRLLAGIDKLQSYRSSSPLASHLKLNFVLMRSNVRELPDFVDLAHELGADAVHAQHVITMTDEAREEPLLIDPGLYDEVRTEALERARKWSIELDLPAAFSGTESANCSVRPDPALEGHAEPCRDPYQTLIVLYNGRVFACCHPMAHDKMQLGDLSSQSFEEVWNNPLYRNLRSGLRCGDVPEICKKCSIVNSPPPVIEDARDFAGSPDVAAHYAGRTMGDTSHAGPLDYIEDLRRHADQLSTDLHATQTALQAAELERGLLRAHAGTLELDRADMRDHIANLERLVSLRPAAVYRQLRFAVRKRIHPDAIANSSAVNRKSQPRESS